MDQDTSYEVNMHSAKAIQKKFWTFWNKLQQSQLFWAATITINPRRSWRNLEIPLKQERNLLKKEYSRRLTLLWPWINCKIESVYQQLKQESISDHMTCQTFWWMIYNSRRPITRIWGYNGNIFIYLMFSWLDNCTKQVYLMKWPVLYSIGTTVFRSSLNKSRHSFILVVHPKSKTSFILIHWQTVKSRF